MQILVRAMFSEKDEGRLCSESGCCSDILTLFCSRVSAIQTGLGTEWCPVGRRAGWWYLLEDQFRFLLGRGHWDLLCMLGEQLHFSSWIFISKGHKD